MDDDRVEIGRSEIACRECGCDTVMVVDALGPWVECTICAWAVPLVIAPGDADHAS
jgi:hypothetical protein